MQFGVRQSLLKASLLLGIACTATYAQVELLGAGATFPYPLYSKMFSVYNQQYGTRINYQSIGSGGGVRQIINKTVDFGASDAFLDDEQLKKAPAALLHVPTCLGAVTITYNLPGNPAIKLNPAVIADIFLVKIKKWDDPKIAALNEGVTLPKLPISVIQRSDGSGTTAIFTDYLCKISPDWEKKVGQGKSVRWPGGLGAKGNEGVSGMVQKLPGSIGYVELAYTVQNKMTVASIQNKKGNFVMPSIESVSLAAEAEIPTDTRVSLTNTDAEQGYPISGFTWILLYKEQSYDKHPKEKATELLKLLTWMVHDGQKYCTPLDYAPLPKAAVAKTDIILNSITYNGKALSTKK